MSAAPIVSATPIAPAAAAIAPYVLPLDSLAGVAESAGLTWVHSDAGKIDAVRAAMAAEPAPVRAPRTVRPVARVDDGPLVLVETKKDLSTMRLPFETVPNETQAGL
jgi:ribonuclease E